jgi:hypothetical protein
LLIAIAHCSLLIAHSSLPKKQSPRFSPEARFSNFNSACNLALNKAAGRKQLPEEH